MNLSPRLAQIADLVPRRKVVADIGTDHGYLPVYLVEKGISPLVIAGEVHERPFEIARKQMEANSLADQVKVRLGDGFSILAPGEAEVAVLAGMGGRNIISILRSHPSVTEGITHFVLQPMTEAEELRLWLSRHFFRLLQEELVVEDRRFYQVLLVGHGIEPASSEVLLTLGPRLVETGHPLLQQHLEQIIRRERDILLQLEEAANPSGDNWERIRYLQTRLEQLEGVRDHVCKGI